MNVIVRRAKRADVDEMVKVYLDCFHGMRDPNLVRKWFECNFNAYPRMQYFVAELDGKVVGYIAIMSLSREEAKIISFAVRKKFRGKGIGKKLLKAAIERCKERGKKKILLEVRVSNFVAQNLYKKMGFKIIDIIPNYYTNGEDAYLMALDISEQ